MGWRQEYARPLNDKSEVIKAPLIAILGPVEAGIDAPHEIDDDDLERMREQRAIAQIMLTLTPREERVLRLRYGFACIERTLEDIAIEFGISRCRVRQIEAKALRKLKHPSRSKRLAKFADVERRTVVPQAPPPLPTLTDAAIVLEGNLQRIKIKHWVPCFRGHPDPGPHAIFDYQGIEWAAAKHELERLQLVT